MIAAGPPTAASGRPPPTTLPKIERSGVMPKRACAPPSADPEAGDHLVEHEQRAVRVHALAQPVEETRRGRRRGPCSRRPARRAPRRSRRRARRSTRVERGEVVVGHDDRVGDRARRDARPSRAARASRHHCPAGDEQRVEVAVVAARELHDLVAAGRAAREPHRGHRGFGARRHEPDLLDRRRRVRRSPRPARPRAASARRTTCRSAAARCTASTTAGCACPRIDAPHDCT